MQKNKSQPCIKLGDGEIQIYICKWLFMRRSLCELQDRAKNEAGDLKIHKIVHEISQHKLSVHEIFGRIQCNGEDKANL